MGRAHDTALKDRDGWSENVSLEEALGAQAWLLGRGSYEFFERGGNPGGELANRLNSMPKHVVSSTLEDPKWNNSTVLQGDLVGET